MYVCSGLFCAVATLSAQHDALWMRAFGGSDMDDAEDVLQTNDGGYLVAGYTNSFPLGSKYAWVIKLDANGDTLWTRIYRDFNTPSAKAACETDDGAYAIVGSSSYTDLAWIFKIDANGDTLWTRNYRGKIASHFADIQQTEDGGYILAGVAGDYGPHHDLRSASLIKTDVNGDTLWTRRYGEDTWSFAWSVSQTNDGGYVLAGAQVYTDPIVRALLVRTDSIGTLLWQHIYGGDLQGYLLDVWQIPDGGFIAAGVSSGAGGVDGLLIRTDANGDTLWTKTYGGSDWDELRAILRVSDTGYVLLGSTLSYGHRDGDAWILAVDAAGDTIWTQTVGGVGYDRSDSGMQTTDGGFIVCGKTRSYGGGSDDLWVFKTDSLGNTISLNAANERSRSMPQIFALHPAYPNPFNPATTIRYELPAAVPVQLMVYDLLGREVIRLVEATQSPGTYEVPWDGTDALGRSLTSGIYIARLVTPEYSQAIKLVLLK
ncbi:T9SS type A sorting domain-containing protein [Candidatus Neomarinimicrobiota bacterium]